VIATPSAFPVRQRSSIPTVTAAQMAEIDRLAVEEFGIDLLQMMEQAGSHVAELVRAELGGDLSGKRVVVAVGPGNNGGGGLTAARHLANRGASVRVILARPVNRLSEAGRHQVATLLEMSVDCCVAIYDAPNEELEREFTSADVIVDAVLGYRSSGAPHDGVAWLIERIARAPAPVISLDLPSGIDPDTGEAAGAAVCAAVTLTLALPKPGLFSSTGRAYAGRVHLGDIGLPAALYRRLGLDVGTPFGSGRIVRLEAGA
jgi:NAD(P)H-hydrate epimerase